MNRSELKALRDIAESLCVTVDLNPRVKPSPVSLLRKRAALVTAVVTGEFPVSASYQAPLQTQPQEALA
jgi:hypothetical protein